MKRWTAVVLLATALVAAVLSLAPAYAAERRDLDAFLSGLTSSQRKQFEAYLSAKTFYDFNLDAYWREVSDKRAARKRKKAQGIALSKDDYALTFPPEYSGPQLSSELARLWAQHQEKSEAPPRQEKPILTVADALASARKHYDFVPERIAEVEFKRRYAREALALGLTKAQVVRVYALETGGQGTADMQSGVNPITKQGKPISTALGYAQLLHANSVDELARHGDAFLDRLHRLAAASAGEAGRVRSLQSKTAALKRMLANARSVPGNWQDHIAYANTSPGIGIHAINLDGDLGPWLQVVKLRGLKDMAEKAGRPRLSGAEIELMNLAGPATGLEMMTPAARDVPTPNFFSRGAYARNSVVRGRTCSELMAELDKRMDWAMSKPGAIEFNGVFDELLQSARAER